MTSAPSTAPARRGIRVVALAIVAFMLLTALAPTPSADAQPPIDLTPRFDIITKDCVDRYPPTTDENGSTICREANPYGDGVYGDQGAFGCSSTVDGRKVYREVDEGYSIDYFPYVEVLSGCYYYPGVTFVPTHTSTFTWTPPSNSFPTSWNFGF